MRPLLSGLVFCVITTSAVAASILDQSHPVSQSTGGRIVYAGNAPAQSFTAGVSGLLSQVDVLLYRDAGDIGQLALEIWPVISGGPAGATPLYSTPIDTNLVPTGSASFVSVDVSAGGIGMRPGQQYVIAVNGSADIDAPNAVWTGGFPAYAGGARFDRAGAWTLNGSDTDYGFRTWVDPTIYPGTLTYQELYPVTEWAASLSSSGGSVISTAGDTIQVQRSTSQNQDRRALLEFDISALPPDAVFHTASLDIDFNQRTSSPGVNPIVDLYGYPADFSPTDADARDTSRLLGTSPAITSLDPVSIPLDVADLVALRDSSPYLGVMAYQKVNTHSVHIVASALADRFPGSYLRPTLTFGYKVESHPAQSHPVGDYNRDARVDAADYTRWRDSLGQAFSPPADGNGDGTVNTPDYDIWTSNFGKSPDTHVANGDFQAGSLAGWTVVTDPNTDVSAGFPRVESFDVDGDGTANSAFRVRLGRLDTDLFGGGVSIEKQILLGAGDYQFAADVASQSLDTGGNTGPGNFELSFDGQIVEQLLLNGTSLASMQVLRNSLEANLKNVGAGYHTLRLTVRRGAVNSRPIYQFIDNIRFTPLTPGASALIVPEPTTATLLALPLAALATFRRRSSQTRSSC